MDDFKYLIAAKCTFKLADNTSFKKSLIFYASSIEQNFYQVLSSILFYGCTSYESPTSEAISKIKSISGAYIETLKKFRLKVEIDNCPKFVESVEIDFEPSFSAKADQLPKDWTVLSEALTAAGLIFCSYLYRSNSIKLVESDYKSDLHVLAVKNEFLNFCIAHENDSLLPF